MYALIDIGSNTIRLVIYDTESGLHEVFNQADYSGLISYVQNGVLSGDGLQHLVEVLNSMHKISLQYECENLYAFATASLRGVADKDGLIESIFQKTGILIDILSGTEEAMFDYRAISEAYKVSEGAAFDLGGGSCQLMFFEHGNLPECKSMPIGALKMYNKYVSGVLPSTEEKKAIAAEVRKQLSDFALLKNSPELPLYAMGGAACTITSMHKKLTGETKWEFTVKELEQITELNEDIISKLAPKRLTTIIPAVITILEICRYIGCDRIFTTAIGVRDGIINNLLQKIN